VYFGLLLSVRALKLDELRVLAGAPPSEVMTGDAALGIEARS
jgi:hypothetical protein